MGIEDLLRKLVMPISNVDNDCDDESDDDSDDTGEVSELLFKGFMEFRVIVLSRAA